MLGSVVGSFLNVVIHRLPRGESLLPGSRCPNCKSPVKPYDNIPVVSYLLLGGRCRNCRFRISAIYPAVELMTAALYLLLFLKDGFGPKLLVDMVFVSLIIPLIFIDLRHKLLPNAITYPGLVLAFLLRALVPHAINGWAASLLESALGAALGGGSLYLMRWFYFRLRHVEGMGLGDVKMMLMVGAFLGWQLTLLVIFAGSLLGSIGGLMLVWLRGGELRKTEIPFGVFLGIASIVAVFIGRELITWYVGLYT
jgi:leader peptidase (prepilin peptidase)/N-methyltransferase